MNETKTNTMISLADTLTGDRLQTAFEYIRKTYFPRWDKKGQWTVSYKGDLPSTGSCDIKNKAIFLDTAPAKDDKLHFLLIHEICHAVTTQSHGKKWKSRMLKASAKAKELGHKEISKMLHENVEIYNKSNKIKAFDVYQLIDEWTTENPDVPYDELIKGVAGYFGCYPEELEEDYKRCKTVYEKARKGQSVTNTWFRKEIIKNIALPNNNQIHSSG